MGSGLLGVSVERNLAATMRDGTKLYADVYRPEGVGTWPVLLMRLPYDKDQAQQMTFSHPSWYARHGYMVVVQDTRGRWSSDGNFYPFKHEADDGHDSIEWAATLAGSNGRVGMYGSSYVGATQLLAAVTRPEHLVCICPALTGSQYYEGWAYNGGAFALAFNLSWAIYLAIDAAHRRGLFDLEQELLAAFLDAPSHYGEVPLSEFSLLKREEIAPYFFDWIEHAHYDGYWRQWSIEERYERIAVPALHIAGWYDIFRDGTIRNFRGLRQRAGTVKAQRAQKLLIGPWFHRPSMHSMEGLDFEEARNVLDDAQLRWFDQLLKGEHSAVVQEPPVRAFVMGENSWRDFDDWPPTNIEMVDFFLHSEGRANSLNGNGVLSREGPGDEPPDTFTYDPRFPIPSLGGHSCCVPGIAPMGAEDQSRVEILNGVLVYSSEPLPRGLLVAGLVEVEVWVASSATDTDFTAKLVNVFPDGTAINLTEGIRRASSREGLERPVPLRPHEPTRLVIDLGNTCNQFGVGHCIRLEISSSNFPHWERHSNSDGVQARLGFGDFTVATQTVLHDGNRPSRLRLPVAQMPKD